MLLASEWFSSRCIPVLIGFPPDVHKNALSMTGNTMPFNSTGHPALTINAGFSPAGEGGLPIGMMIVGKKFDEVTVLQVARAFEKLANKK